MNSYLRLLACFDSGQLLILDAIALKPSMKRLPNKLNTFCNVSINVRSEKKNTKHSSNTLLRLVFFFSEQTLCKYYISFTFFCIA